MSLTWACDPGLSGAIAYTDGETIEVWEMPVIQVAGRREIIIPKLVSIFLQAERAKPHTGIRRLYLERVSARPGQGVVSMFRFGESYGIIRGVCAGRGIPVELVTPQAWKKAMKVPSGKDSGRFRAMEEFPMHTELFERKKDHGRADAALLALYGRRKEGNETH